MDIQEFRKEILEDLNKIMIKLQASDIDAYELKKNKKGEVINSDENLAYYSLINLQGNINAYIEDDNHTTDYYSSGCTY